MFGQIALIVAAATLPTRLPPVDTCTKDPAFVAFRGKLTDAVKRRDLNALMTLMSEKMQTGFGDRTGRGEFRRYSEANEAERAAMWSEFDDALRLGCAPKGNSQSFPSMFGQSGKLDAFSVLVARSGARLRASPSLDGRIVRRLDWHVLNVESGWAGGEWVPVHLPHGPRGFVHRTATRSIIDYRIVTQLKDGRWQIVAFIAGD
jgi:hypothetical protein